MSVSKITHPKITLRRDQRVAILSACVPADPCRGRKNSPSFTKLLKTRAKPGKAAKNNREKQERLAGAKAGKAGKQQAIETGPPPRKMKDEAEDEAVIVFLGPGVAAFPRKRARSRDMHRQTPSKKPGALSGLASCAVLQDDFFYVSYVT